MLIQRLFDLLRRDVGTAADDDLLQAAFEPVISTFIAHDQIAGMEPSTSEEFRRRVGIIPVANAVRRTAKNELANFAGLHVVSSLINNPERKALWCNAD